jgi:hypothetical protein
MDDETTQTNLTHVEMLSPTDSERPVPPQKPPSSKFRIMMDNAFRYSCLAHIIIQFLFIVLFASLSENVDWPRRVNICVSMFVVVPILVWGFASTGSTFGLSLRFKANIIFSALILLVGVTMCALNVWIIALDSVLALVCLCVNGFVFVGLFALSVVRVIALRKEILFLKQNPESLVDEL